MHYLLNGKPEDLINKLGVRDQIRCRTKFIEIEGKIRQQRSEQDYYNNLLPKLEAEMNYVVTYRDPK